MICKRLSSFLLVFALVFTCLTETASANTTDLYGNAGEEAAAIAEMLITAGAATGIQYAMIENGEIVVSGKAGAYSPYENRELTTDDLFGAGSVSKMFTAAAAMNLMEEGKLDIDTPVVEYIPDFVMADIRYRSITMRMLLNHSSGLSGSTLSNAFLFGDNDQDATYTFLEKLESQSLRFDPGAFSVYCNDGFILAQLLIERISGQNFTEYLHETFFNPLGMEHTKTSADDFDLRDIVDSNPYGVGTPRELVNVIGTGGVYTTAEDLCRFTLALTGDKILTEDSSKQMMAKEYLNGIWPSNADDNVLGYGLGWDSVDMYPYNQYEITALSKDGDTSAYHAKLVVLPEYGLAAAVLSAGGSSVNNTYIANALLEGALLAKGEIEEKFSGKQFETTAQAMPAEMKEYAGFYGSFLQVVKADITEDGKLLITSASVPGGSSEEYVYTGDNGFTDEAGQIRLSFVREGDITYIRMDVYANAPEVGAVTASSQYYLQKLESNIVDDATAAAWAEREGSLYFIVNEKYSSLVYMNLPAIGIGQMAEFPGYVGAMRIEDANTARSVLQIPGVSGRDLRDVEFISEDGVEYALYSDYKAIKMSEIQLIYSGLSSICTIQPNGEARWYLSDSAHAGKTMSVDVPENAAFFVYDAMTGACVMNSYAFDKNEVELPDNALIAFSGEAGARFVITLK